MAMTDFELPDADDGSKQSIKIENRPNTDQLRQIGNMAERSRIIAEPFNLVAFVIQTLCKDWRILDRDGSEIPSDTKNIGRIPADISMLIFNECWSVVGPLIPNFERVAAQPTS